MLAQVIAFAVVCILGGLTYIGVEPRLSVEKGIPTPLGMETVHKWTSPNVWIGPSQKHLIGVGGVFAPCMREDIGIQLQYSRQNYSTHTALGCCEITSRNIAGTATEAECHLLSEGVGTWRAKTCAARPSGENSVRHLLKPCCVGIRGQCRLLSHKHCIFLGGLYHQFGVEHCSQVNCLSYTCRPGHLPAMPSQPWLPLSPNQWWRLPMSLLYHQGVIHLVLVLLAHWLLLTQIERTAGWLRMAIIYMLAGSGALLTSAIFSPYQCHVGTVGAVFGMVGVTLVEVIQFWSIIPRPVLEVAKIIGGTAIFVFCGTLPYLDMFGMLAGLIIGILTGIIVLPYITFGRWQTGMRIVLLLVAVPLLVVALVILVHLFVNVQSVENCSICRQMNCVAYTGSMCNSSIWQQ